MGFRRLLNRAPAAEDPLERFAELGREEAADHPPGLFPSAATESRAAPVVSVAVDKEPVFRREGRSPNYVWLSEKSRRARTDWADQLFRPF